MCCFTKPLTWEREDSSVQKQTMKQANYARQFSFPLNSATYKKKEKQIVHEKDYHEQCCWNLEESRHQLPFFLQFAHRLGKLLLGALMPELPHLQGQTIT